MNDIKVTRQDPKGFRPVVITLDSESAVSMILKDLHELDDMSTETITDILIEELEDVIAECLRKK